MKLKDKVAIVTGASKGIGQAIALHLAKAGAKVVVSSRKLADVQLVADEINASYPNAAIAIQAHMGSEDDIKTLISETLTKLGGIDILVNNAATNPIYGPTEDASSEAFDKIMQINLKAPFELSNLAKASMKSRGGGAIIHISSIAGHKPDPGLGLYSVSKAALNMLTMVQANEWGADGIRVNAICPGLIKTKFSQALWQDEAMLKHYTKEMALKRMGTVDEIAPMVVFLASQDAAYMTGQLITIDGGYLV